MNGYGYVPKKLFMNTKKAIWIHIFTYREILSLFFDFLLFDHLKIEKLFWAHGPYKTHQPARFGLGVIVCTPLPYVQGK